MSYIIQDCYSSLTSQGLTPCDAPNDTQATSACGMVQKEPGHIQICTNVPPLRPIQTFICKNSKTGARHYFPTDQLIQGCSALTAKDPNWGIVNCYCCCHNSINSVMIDTPTGSTAVQFLKVGDLASIGSILKNNLSWNPMALTFVSGISTPTAEDMITISCANTLAFTVTPDHVFVLANNLLKTAATLMATDTLLGSDGSSVKIISIHSGPCTGNVYNLSVLSTFDGTLNNHLISSNDIVSGDYTLQLNFSQLDDRYKAIPVLTKLK